MLMFVKRITATLAVVIFNISAPACLAAPASAAIHCNADAAPEAALSDKSELAVAWRACPMLGQIVETFAMRDLGEEFPIAIAIPRPQEMATVAASAAKGDAIELRLFTKIALANGATRPEFEEMLYLTAVNEGIPKAIEATLAIADLLVPLTANQCADVLSYRSNGT